MLTVQEVERGSLLTRGKVRDIYATNDPDLLWVEATDRISIFDVVLGEPVRGKGAVLTHMTKFWLTEVLANIPNHFVGTKGANVMIVRRAEMLPVEAIVRGYITGSGWKDYQRDGAICGIPLPPGMLEAQLFDPFLFTPSTKAEQGEHDENITIEVLRRIFVESGFDPELVDQVAGLSLDAYSRGHHFAKEVGIIIADTKFEWGLVDGTLTLCDEVLTPDSSRFWPADEWKPGATPSSFDKQPVRDWGQALADQGLWDKRVPAPPCPQEVLDATTERYREVSLILTGTAPNESY